MTPLHKIYCSKLEELSFETNARAFFTPPPLLKNEEEREVYHHHHHHHRHHLSCVPHQYCTVKNYMWD
jgi:hypothetical protein